MKSLFIMCNELKHQVEALTQEVKALREAQIKKDVQIRGNSEQIVKLGDDVENSVDFQVSEIARIDSTLAEVTRHVKITEEEQSISVKHIKALEKRAALFASSGQVSSVSNQVSRHKKLRYTQPRPRICYNCRKSGHFAAMCSMPNPRNPDLSGQPNAVSNSVAASCPVKSQVEDEDEIEQHVTGNVKSMVAVYLTLTAPIPLGCKTGM